MSFSISAAARLWTAVRVVQRAARSCRVLAALALAALAASPLLAQVDCSQTISAGTNIPFGNGTFGGTSGAYVYAYGEGGSDICGRGAEQAITARTWMPIYCLGQYGEGGRVEANLQNKRDGYGGWSMKRRVQVNAGLTVIYVAFLPNGVVTNYSSGVTNMWSSAKSKVYAVGTGSVTLTGNPRFSASYSLKAISSGLMIPSGVELDGSMTVAGQAWSVTASGGGEILGQSLRYPAQTLQLNRLRAYEWRMVAQGVSTRLWGTAQFEFVPDLRMWIAVRANGVLRTLVKWNGTPRIVPLLNFPVPMFPLFF